MANLGYYYLREVEKLAHQRDMMKMLGSAVIFEAQ